MYAVRVGPIACISPQMVHHCQHIFICLLCNYLHMLELVFPLNVFGLQFIIIFIVLINVVRVLCLSNFLKMLTLRTQIAN